MSIAQAQKQREMDSRLSEVEAAVIDIHKSVKALMVSAQELSARLEAIENKPRPGRPPKDSP
jgi:hypothetical protein